MTNAIVLRIDEVSANRTGPANQHYNKQACTQDFHAHTRFFFPRIIRRETTKLYPPEGISKRGGKQEDSGQKYEKSGESVICEHYRVVRDRCIYKSPNGVLLRRVLTTSRAGTFLFYC